MLFERSREWKKREDVVGKRSRRGRWKEGKSPQDTAGIMRG